MFDQMKAYLFKPIPTASLGMFRIIFGLMMVWQFLKIKPYLVETLTDSKFFLTYDFFHWITILPKEQMAILVNSLAICSFFLAIGLFYRFAAALVFLGWTYFFLLDIGHYNNHYYLYCLFAFLLVFIHADRWGSLNSLFKKHKKNSVPYWQLLIVQLQVFVAYFYGGIAKLEYDWFQGYPMKIWLHYKADYPFIGSILESDATAICMSYTGLVFDLVIGFMLFSKRLRLIALVPICFFHISNSIIWYIGTFPWFMLATTLIFFEPDLPERWIGRFRKKSKVAKPRAVIPNLVLSQARQKVALAFFSVYLLIQFLFPLRHWFYSGNTAWHGQGQLFAWRMMLVDRADAIKVKVNIPGKGTVGQVKLEEYVCLRQFMSLSKTPKAMHRFAHFIKKEIAQNSGIDNAEINIVFFRQLNSRPFQLVMDSTLDMTSIPYKQIEKVDWILPFENLPYKENFEKLTPEELATMGLSINHNPLE